MSMQASSEHIPSYLNQYYIMTPPQHNSRSKYLNYGRLSQEGLAMMAQAQMEASNGFSRMQYYTRGNSDQDYHQQALEELHQMELTQQTWLQYE